MSQIADLLNLSVRHIPDPSITYDPGNTRSIDLTADYPIDRIHCRLSGTMNQTTGALSYAAFGFLNLIKSLRIILNGTVKLVDVAGRYLPIISWVDSEGRLSYSSEPSLAATGNGKNFVKEFVIDLNPLLPWQSLLDATRRAGNNSLKLEVDWDAASTVIAGGAGYTVNTGATKLEVRTVAMTGGPDNKPGGAGYPYWRRTLLSQTIPVVSAQPDLEVKLDRYIQHQRFIIIAEAALAPVDTILQRVRLEVGTTQLFNFSRDDLKGDNTRRYNMLDRSESLVGRYILDLCDPGRIEQMQMALDGPGLRLLFDVTPTGGGADRLVIISDRYSVPTKA